MTPLGIARITTHFLVGYSTGCFILALACCAIGAYLRWARRARRRGKLSGQSFIDHARAWSGPALSDDQALAKATRLYFVLAVVFVISSSVSLLVFALVT